MNAVELFGYVGFVGAILGGVTCWFIAVVSIFRTVANRKPGVPMFARWWESPFNILFRPQQLTDRGLAARRWCIYGSLGFIACLILAVIIGVATGVTEFQS